MNTCCSLIIKVKAHAVRIGDEPHLIFKAVSDIDVGDEILFDYNDRAWKMSFLKQCPVCLQTPPTSVVPTEV